MVRLVVRAPRRGAVVRRRVHHARGPGRRTGAFASGVVGAFLEQTAAEHPFDDGPAHEARVLERDVVVAGDLVLPPHTGRRRGGGAGVGGPGRAAALGGLATKAQTAEQVMFGAAAGAEVYQTDACLAHGCGERR